MPRDLPIGNGNVLINFDKQYNLRDIYFPYVGQENHALDHLSHFGVWSEQGFYWIDHPEWKKQTSYLPDSLVTNVVCQHESMQLEMTIRDTVDVIENVMVRKVVLENKSDQEKAIKLYFHLDLHLYGTPIGDTVYYNPDLHSLVFYKGHRYFSLSCYSEHQKNPGPTAYATGQKEIHGLEGTWRDAEDGQLGNHPIAQGSVDGTIELEMSIPAKGKSEAWFWICFAKSMNEINRLEEEVRAKTPQHLIQRTNDHWSQWIQKDKHDLHLLEVETADFYRRSLLIILSHTDRRGAIIAANDSDILKFAKDTYSYMWPRDGALISHALDRAGYHQLTRRFFDFCKKALTNEGYLMHKYNPDGSVGSSWHPYVNAQGKKQLPIQEDETALVIYALWHHHKLADTLKRAKDDYEQLVIPAADFLVRYRDASGLPLPSYDLWEERYGVFAFTAASVYAGLLAASNFAATFKDKARSAYYKDTAEKVKQAMEAHMYSKQKNQFIRALYWNDEQKTYDADEQVDASMYALFDFNVFAPDDPRIVNMMKEIKQTLWVNTEVGGLARYKNDPYQQVSQDIDKVPGNPWFICTLWYAEWVIAKANKQEELEEAKQILEWTRNHALPSGVLSEQINPYTGEPVSVSPLIWSHSSFVKVVQEYLSKWKQFQQVGNKQAADISDEKILKPIGTK